MTWVKICGMTNLEDALVAVDAGADAVGFVFYEKSPRCVTVEAAREIVEKLPESVEKVGVFVNAARRWRSRSKSCGDADGNPALHPAASPDVDPHTARSVIGVCHALRKLYLMAFRMRLFVRCMRQLSDLAKSLGCRGVSCGNGCGLMRGFSILAMHEMPGGTGKTFDWTKAASVLRTKSKEAVRSVVVAGGLTPENVGEAIEILQPWGVDVVSGWRLRRGRRIRRRCGRLCGRCGRWIGRWVRDGYGFANYESQNPHPAAKGAARMGHPRDSSLPPYCSCE